VTAEHVVQDYADELHAVPVIDGNANHIILVVGRKGSGKSEVAQTLYRHWDPPIDRVCIDPTGDARPGANAKRIEGTPPTRMPNRPHEDEPVNLHYLANPRSPTYYDDLDRAIGTALYPRDRRALLWVDEIGQVSRVNKTPPNLNTLLMQARHHHASAILAGPRPVGIDRLCLQQADRVYMFQLPNPADRKRIALEMGIDPDVMEDAHVELVRHGKFWHLVFIVGEDEPYLCPPIPPEWRRDPAETP
jgi:energy-coupling factor transporter ATP-binding protein EcfA2